MGTRANIIVELAPQQFGLIYTHWDGYPSSNGVILDRFYDTYEKAVELITPGDLSSLSVRCDAVEGHTFDNRAPFTTNYYGRDRGEKGPTAARIADSLEEALKLADNEWVYVRLREGDGWLFCEPKLQWADDYSSCTVMTEETDLSPLAPFLAQDEHCLATIKAFDDAGETREWAEANCPHTVNADAKYDHDKYTAVPLDKVAETEGVVYRGDAPAPAEAPAPKKRRVAKKAEKTGAAYQDGAWA